MSIPVLTQVYDEVRRLAIAGSVVAVNDFRLKKLLAPLEQAGKKAPVFSKVASAVQNLVESDEKTSAEALLELSTLVNAILYTQGETGAPGELTPIETIDLGQQQTQTSARVLKPLVEALSSTGSGRIEIVKEAYERGAFRDLRLVGSALAALDDPYPELADFIAECVLPLYGAAIISELRQAFDPKGRGGHVRRLTLMHQLDPAGSRDLVKRSLDEGSKEVRIAAIACLGGSQEDLVFLLEQAKAKAKDVRAAALLALGRSSAVDASNSLCAAIKGSDLELAVKAVQASNAPTVLKTAVGESRAQMTALTRGKQSDKAKLGQQAARMLLLLDCLEGRKEHEVDAFLLEAFENRAALAAVKSEPSGKDIEQRLASIMALGSPKVQMALAQEHAGLPADELGDALVAAMAVWKPAEVFKQFSAYLSAEGKKKSRGAANTKVAAVAMALTSLGRHRRRLVGATTVPLDDPQALDPRWLDVAVEQEVLELVQELARPGHAGACALMSRLFEQQLKDSKEFYKLASTLDTMLRLEHPGAADAVIAAIGRHAGAAHGYAVHYLGEFIPRLPKQALPKVESLLTTLNDRAVDQLMDHVAQLRNRP